jgi:sensory rhodopsin
MLSFSLWSGLVLFCASSIYFFFANRRKGGLNTAFLVSLITTLSYILMLQGNLTVTTEDEEPIYWTRWLFYGASCTLLIYEIAQVKGIGGGDRAQLLYLTAIVMGTGFLAARDLSAVRWAFFLIGAVAYLLLIVRLLSIKTRGTRWTHHYIWFGWTVFPVVFLFAPTGWGVFGPGLTAFLYLLLDLYTKIVFGLQLAKRS